MFSQTYENIDLLVSSKKKKMKTNSVGGFTLALSGICFSHFFSKDSQRKHKSTTEFIKRI